MTWRSTHAPGGRHTPGGQRPGTTTHCSPPPGPAGKLQKRRLPPRQRGRHAHPTSPPLHRCSDTGGGATYVDALPSSATAPMRSASAPARPNSQATHPAPWPKCAQPGALTGRRGGSGGRSSTLRSGAISSGALNRGPLCSGAHGSLRGSARGRGALGGGAPSSV